MINFEWRSDPYLPKLDITGHVTLLGDFFSQNDNETRMTTTVRMIVDYE